jgi:antirestriction protein ArdC
MPSQNEIQAEITARIIEGLKQGTIPWRKPWRNDLNSGSPANVVSKRLYSSINPLLLDLVSMTRGYQCIEPSGADLWSRDRYLHDGASGSPT